MWQKLKTSFLFGRERLFFDFYNRYQGLICWEDEGEYCIQTISDFGRSLVLSGVTLWLSGQCNGYPYWSSGDGTGAWHLYFTCGKWYLLHASRTGQVPGYIPSAKYSVDEDGEETYSGDEYYTRDNFVYFGTVGSSVAFSPGAPRSGYTSKTLTYAQTGRTFRDSTQLDRVEPPYGTYGSHTILTPYWSAPGGRCLVRLDESHDKWAGAARGENGKLTIAGDGGWWEYPADPVPGQNAVAVWHELGEDGEEHTGGKPDFTSRWYGCWDRETAEAWIYEVNIWR